MPKLPIEIIPAEPEHLNYILNSWMRSYRAADATEGIPNDVYYPEQELLVRRLGLVSVVNVAAWESDHNQVYGWVCGDRIGADGELVVHYIYVKKQFRRLGIASRLLDSIGYIEGERITATHITYVSYEETVKQKVTLRNNPYLAARIAYEASRH